MGRIVWSTYLKGVYPLSIRRLRWRASGHPHVWPHEPTSLGFVVFRDILINHRHNFGVRSVNQYPSLHVINGARLGLIYEPGRVRIAYPTPSQTARTPHGSRDRAQRPPQFFPERGGFFCAYRVCGAYLTLLFFLCGSHASAWEPTRTHSRPSLVDPHRVPFALVPRLRLGTSFLRLRRLFGCLLMRHPAACGDWSN